MSVILEWGHAYRNITDDSKRLQKQYLTEPDETKAEEILEHLLDIIDTRRVCVVVSNKDSITCVRHIFGVSENASERLDELKAEYYANYAQLPTDEFFFFTGLHRAHAFAERKQGS